MTAVEMAMLTMMTKQAKALDRIADAMETMAVSRPVIDWQDAVDVLMATCENAEGCDLEGCPMFLWCDKNLPDDKAPNSWEEVDA